MSAAELDPGPEPRPTCRLELELLGSRVCLTSRDGVFLEQLARCFGPAVHTLVVKAADLELEVGAPLAGPVGIVQPRELRARALEVEPEVFRPGAGSAVELCNRLVQWAVDTPRAPYALHAGAVCSRGRAILLPGASGAGKSTTTAGLLRRGFELLSDEVALLELGSTRVTGLARALGLRADVLEVLGVDPAAGVEAELDESRMVQPELFGARRADAPAELALIARPEYRAGSPVVVERCTPGEAAATLLECSWSQPRYKLAGFDGVVEVATRVPAVRVVFSELDAALDAIVERFERACGERD